MNSFTVDSTSPLYEYWKSKQTDIDNQQRILLSNNQSPAASLFINEPYKWEILFQSTMNDLLKGDLGGIPALKILLDTLQEKVRIEFFNKLREKKYFDEKIILILENKKLEKPEKSRSKIKKIIILCFIFFNPYGIDLKGNKKHIYEYTGAFSYKLRSFFRKLILLKSF
tara:strand:+ start:1427 stop:1933 length:507 start_codon:yes stop_codon:yes gene_type:complete